MTAALKIGTRGSALALWQARTVARLIEDAGGPACEIVVILTSGDERPRLPEPAVASADARTSGPHSAAPNVKRMFVKEIEEALLDGRVDLAVHSAKDLPADVPDGLAIAAAIERGDPRDALLLPGTAAARGFEHVKAVLGRSPRIGTSSVRRTAELRGAFSDAAFVPIRGNVDTRLRKLDAGECDALVLAAAGVTRLGLAHRLSAILPTDVCVPAPGQGIVAVEIAARAPESVRHAVRRIGDPDAHAALIAERAAMQALGGGCQVPLGVFATIEGADIIVSGSVSSLDGTTRLRARVTGNRGGAAAAGEKLAAQLLAQGAGDILK